MYLYGHHENLYNYSVISDGEVGQERTVFPYRDAYVRLLQSLEASSEDFLFVLRICPKIDEDNHMLINDVLVSIEAMLII